MLELISSSDFLTSIKSLIQEKGVVITADDSWLPLWLNSPRETQLKEFLGTHFNPQLGIDIKNWWLAVPKYRTPNWDFISTCKINGQKGILLIEAKAHRGELNGESHGKKLKKTASENSKKNHIKIGVAIKEANDEINKTIGGVSISIDNCYQLSNRVAHAWWLANQGIPVILVYLGFLNVKDMEDGQRTILRTDEDWKACFINHATQVGVDRIVDEWVECGKSGFKLIVKNI